MTPPFFGTFKKNYENDGWKVLLIYVWSEVSHTIAKFWFYKIETLRINYLCHKKNSVSATWKAVWRFSKKNYEQKCHLTQ